MKEIRHPQKVKTILKKKLTGRNNVDDYSAIYKIITFPPNYFTQRNIRVLSCPKIYNRLN